MPDQTTTPADDVTTLSAEIAASAQRQSADQAALDALNDLSALAAQVRKELEPLQSQLKTKTSLLAVLRSQARTGGKP